MTVRQYKVLLEKFAAIELVEAEKRLDPNVKPAQTILHSANWPEGQILDLAVEGTFQTFLNTNHRHFESELFAALATLDNPAQFINDPLPFLFRETPTSLLLPFQKKEQKAELLQQITPFLNATGSRIVQEHARVLFEELFMNAVFDAPVEAKKLGFGGNKKHCELTLAYDSEKFVISCFDSYGSLNTQKLVERIRDIHNHGTKNIINLGQRKGGAGIGCSLLYRYSSSMSLVVNQGRGTRVTCSLPLKISQKSFSALGKNLQIINMKPAGGNHGK